MSLFGLLAAVVHLLCLRSTSTAASYVDYDPFLSQLQVELTQGKVVNMDEAVLHCNRVYDQLKDRGGREVSFLKLFGELLFEVKNEARGLEVLEEAVEAFEGDIRALQLEALAGRHELAFNQGKELLKYFPDDYLLNLELGVIQFVRQDYSSALSLCSTAASALLSSGSVRGGDSQAYSCMGVAATYLGLEEVAVPALLRAYELLGVPPAIPSGLCHLSRGAMEASLLQALTVFGRFAQCVETAADTLMQLRPSSEAARAYIIVFSMVQWTDPAKIAQLQALHQALRRRNIFPSTDEEFSLLEEVRRVQQRHIDILTPLATCLRNSSSTLALAALNDLYAITRGLEPWELGSMHRHLERTKNHAVLIDTDAVVGADMRSSPRSSAGIVLISQHYHESSPGRDLVVALAKNLMNPLISDVVLFCDEEVDFSQLPHAHKIWQLLSGPTSGRAGSRARGVLFQMAIDFAAAEFPGRTVIIANSDISFDHTLSTLGDIGSFPNSSVLAVSKWQDWAQSPDQQSTHFTLRVDSQDAWIFRSPLSTCASSSSAFPMGEVGCDNRLAGALRGCGYSVSDPGLFLRATEHCSKHRVTTLYSGGGGGGGGGGEASGFVLLADSPPDAVFKASGAAGWT